MFPNIVVNWLVWFIWGSEKCVYAYKWRTRIAEHLPDIVFILKSLLFCFGHQPGNCLSYGLSLDLRKRSSYLSHLRLSKCCLLHGLKSLMNYIIMNIFLLKSILNYLINIIYFCVQELFFLRPCSVITTRSVFRLWRLWYRLICFFLFFVFLLVSQCFGVVFLCLFFEKYNVFLLEVFYCFIWIP